jgi:hypothetical protein
MSQPTLPLAPPPRQSTTVDCDFLTVIRIAVLDEGWGPESLGAHIKRDKSLVSRTLNGERPLSGCQFILSLPVGVQRRLAAAWGRHLGLIVVEPDTDHETACRHVLGAFVWMLSSISASREAIDHSVRGLSWVFGKQMAKASLLQRDDAKATEKAS